jgi:hypothetical protein
VTHYIRLRDGSVVSSDSEAWRHECEARAVAKLSTAEERNAWLAAIAVKRGQAAADRLRETVSQLQERRT